MNLKKTGVAIAMAAMLISGAALAGGGHGHGHGHGGGGEVDYYSHNGNGPGNDNNDIETNNGNDDNTYTSNKGAGDDNNKEWNDSANVGNGDDHNKQWNNSANTTNTMTKTDNSHTLIFEVDMVVAESDLDAHISNSDVEYGESAGSGYKKRGRHGGGCNTCQGAGVRVNNSNTMTGFNNAAGITTVSQSAGANSLVQQSVVTNATVKTN